MAHANNQAKAQQNVVLGWLSRLSTAQLETLAIVMNVNQMSWLMSSLHEAQNGQIVPVEHAFADLQDGPAGR